MNLYIVPMSLFIYIILMIFIFYCQPTLIYCKKYGSFRQFGLGYSDKTILPIWLVSIILSIISYLGVSYIFLK